ncbi:THO complex subunit 1 transcription elongation factor-domain-containing protein [Apiosordaria backusii]|uniref:THO complex subunit 1 transcription elongation factor-domain-containing protein n=1 Tax=Apiosordaria backusii TaxID=314023 RepID=A0AA40AIN0_9PEZI|nr:THO complex subunit 1 transcription elongation factor-domain-containing protein [Apiosordaria backusii]
MPATIIDSHGIPAVAKAGAFLQQLLEHAETVKRTSSIEPPIIESNFDDLHGRMNDIYDDEPTADDSSDAKTARFAIIETAVRDTFKYLVSRASIDSPEFVKVWNLFDILSILSDSELCDPALLLWLVEELLDSQTVAGCRKVFDFLESRRERITAKHFKQKQLVILRTCNELLRRLSRALDPAFSGRVLIFMFQSFPLGDKSSVNLRGEYHTENVTTFDQTPAKVDGDGDKMDVDTDVSTPGDGSRRGRSNGVDAKKKALDPDVLYPIFWALQESFNQPKLLFEPSHFASFKSGLEATMATFLSIKLEQPPRIKERPDRPVEELNHTSKRKRQDSGDTLSSDFNPKYLTSRDLFKLEISDLTFRRNILIQALIIMEFLLALSPKAKEKLATVKAPNKSVMYTEKTLGEDEIKWVVEMKESIKSYLKLGPEGPHFCRLVETVLSRDKNWVRWKIENCPSIELPQLSPDLFVAARTKAGKLATTKRLRATPMGSLNLDFLGDDDEERAMKKLKDCHRYKIPALESYKRGIADDDFEIEMPTNSESKTAAIEGKASKAWRALRIASKTKLVAFDKIEDDDKIDVIFEELPAEKAEEDEEITNGDTVFPEDRRPIVVVDAGKHSSTSAGLAKQLYAHHPKTFTKVAVHVTRKPTEGEVNGKDFHFIDTQAFNMMRDGDQFLEFSEEGDDIHGTSRKVVDAIVDNDRVAVMEMTFEGAQQVKDNGYDARFIFIRPPAAEILEGQLKESGLSEEQVQQAVKAAAEATEHANSSSGFYEAVVDGEYRALETAIFGAEIGAEKAEAGAPNLSGEADGKKGEDGGDVAMDDAAPTS